ncbi:MAG: RNA ligase family protein [Solirubrobacterales bacterium]|nr:RNA ligase family protein [Solirubrobacterales bacterium]
MIGFVRFPRTPHLALLGSVDVRDDKVMSPEAAQAFLDEELHVEEKVDGENLGLSVVDGRLMAQSRGSYVELGGQSFRGLAAWLEPRASRIAGELGQDLILFGEWCAVRHSVPYDALPDWLLVFDVYDHRIQGFWQLDERDLLAEALGLSRVPRLAKGRFDLTELQRQLGMSRFGDTPMEGLVLRHTERPGERAKLVRPEFLQAIDEHWRSQPVELNRLAGLTARN